MPSIRYMNQSAPFWDFIANMEGQGANHPFFNQNREAGESSGEEGPWGSGWGWGWPHRGWHRGPPPFGPPHPPQPPPAPHAPGEPAAPPEHEGPPGEHDGTDQPREGHGHDRRRSHVDLTAMDAVEVDVASGADGGERATAHSAWAT